MRVFEAWFWVGFFFLSFLNFYVDWGLTKKISIKKISLYFEAVGFPAFLHKHEQAGEKKKASIFIFA